MKIAVVGATGAVGETILRLLEERNLPVDSLGTFASRRRDAAVRFRGNALDVQPASGEALRGYDVVFFAGGEDASERYARALVENGAVVIDNSATFRLERDVPLIVPEINAGALRAEHRLLPVANCTAIVLCTALRPIRDTAGLLAVNVATYQAASGAGRDGIEELLEGERALVAGLAEPPPSVFTRPLARNVVPQVGSFGDDGWSSEELKIRAETRKMLDLPDLTVAVDVGARSGANRAQRSRIRENGAPGHPRRIGCRLRDGTGDRLPSRWDRDAARGRRNRRGSRRPLAFCRTGRRRCARHRVCLLVRRRSAAQRRGD